MRYSEQLALINQFKSRQPPIDVEGLAAALGVEVKYSFLDPDTSGVIERVNGDKFRILVNATHPHTRQRFTIAHELGHYMLHRHLIGEGIADNRAYRSDHKARYRNTDIGPTQETQANKFAVSILMPDSALAAVNHDNQHNSPAAKAKALGVSEQAYCIRAGIQYEPGFL